MHPPFQLTKRDISKLIQSRLEIPVNVADLFMGSVSLNSVSVTHSRIFHILFFAIFVALSFLNIFFSHLFEIATLANLCWILDIWMIHQQNIRTIKLNAQFLLSVLFEFSNLKCYVISESLFHSDLYSCWQIRI